MLILINYNDAYWWWNKSFESHYLSNCWSKNPFLCIVPGHSVIWSLENLIKVNYMYLISVLTQGEAKSFSVNIPFDKMTELHSVWILKGQYVYYILQVDYLSQWSHENNSANLPFKCMHNHLSQYDNQVKWYLNITLYF